MTKNSIIIGSLLSPGAAIAHPDHALGGGYGLAHHLTDPFHIALMAAAVLLCLAVRRSIVHRRRVSRPIR